MKIMVEDAVSLICWNSCIKNKPLRDSEQVSCEADQKQCCELPQQLRAIYTFWYKLH